MWTTVFVPVYEGGYDDEYGPHVYIGKLDRGAILMLGLELVSPGYKEVAVEGSTAAGWLLTFHHEEGAVPVETNYGASFVGMEGCGALVYNIEYCEAK